jgi:alpha-galactosidase
LVRLARRAVSLLIACELIYGISTVSIIAQRLSDLRTPEPSNAPRINGPVVYGVRADHPFLYRVPCTGSRPMRFSIKGLPSSMTFDPETGVFSGRTPKEEGDYPITIEASNQFGKTNRSFTITVGKKLGLTPQMGWNDWYTHYDHVTDSDIRKAADAMISSGMADYGYQFIDIDDAWERKPESNIPDLMGPPRDENGNIVPNRRFPDMKALTEYIHSLGLKAGIYSSPGPLTCGGFTASYEHEEADALLISRWGFDLLKYDMCSYREILKENSLAELQKPYVKMGALIEKQNRDIVFNLCQYGLGDVWRWARSIGGSSWRSTRDVGAVRGDTLPGFYKVGFANAALDAYSGPGGWNDPDYILIGTVGDPLNLAAGSQPTRLTPGEQYSYMSMWALMASPLFFSGDMTKLDTLTLNILENSEVIDIDQDALGKQAGILRHTPQEFVLVKPMSDGSLAVGLFNVGSTPLSMSLDLKEINLKGKVKIRDVWRQKYLGSFAYSFTARVPVHDVELIRIKAE